MTLILRASISLHGPVQRPIGILMEGDVNHVCCDWTAQHTSPVFPLRDVGKCVDATYPDSQLTFGRHTVK